MIEYTAVKDLNEIGELYREWSGKGYSDKLLLWNSYFMGARDRDNGGKLVGCVQSIMIDDPFWGRRWCLVENVFVLPEYRNRGIAKGLMEKVEMFAKVFECQFIKLTSGFGKVEGHALYKSMGYEEGSSFKKALR